jgi:hypothetical protein
MTLMSTTVHPTNRGSWPSFKMESSGWWEKGTTSALFAPNKITAGDRQSLEMHALDLRHTSENIQDRADHQALAKFLYGDNLPEFSRPSTRRRHWWWSGILLLWTVWCAVLTTRSLHWCVFVNLLVAYFGKLVISLRSGLLLVLASGSSCMFGSC